MHNILLFTLLPHLSHAFYPYNNDQAPLIDSPADITLPLQVCQQLLFFITEF